jgi:eukaryotic-like serine/threonine-protein kinase
VEGTQPGYTLSDILSRISAALADRYRLERELGSGGMATVYLAEDLKHRRKVAVKVLRPELAATVGSDRFLREIETAAQFQHPHILPLLDSGEAGGFLYYVMPYVEGESLRTRLTRRGELPIHDAVKILVEVCDALAYAHAHGVVHRDIKPDNVLLSGRHALVADFGVAKALSEATGRQRFTTAGVALGTPAYMAPEQAAAEPDIDHRADIYALGALGYELVSGEPPFTGRTSQEVLAAHVTQAPEPLCGRRPACPPGFESVIMRCLEKRRADRWQTADELLAELEQLATPSGGTTPTQTRPTLAVGGRRPRATRLGVAAAALLVLVGLGVALSYRPAGHLPVLGKRSAVTLDPGLEMTPAISPDGKTVAYSRMTPTESRLLVRQLAGGEPVTVARIAGLHAPIPAWSPDGTRLLYSSRRGLEVIPALGGVSRLVATQPLANVATGGGSWAPDGEQIVYPSGDTVYIRRLTEDAPRVLLTAGQPHSPVWSPNGQWIAYVSGNLEYAAFANIAPSSIWVVPAAGGSPVRITEDLPLHASPAWLPDSRGLLYVSDQDGGRDVYFVGLSRAGTPQGKPARLTTGLNPHTISLSADGRRLTYSSHTETANVIAVQLNPGRSVSLGAGKPITSGSQVIEGFSVAPDGRWLVFDSNRNGNQDIWRMPLDGSSPVEPLSAGPEDEFQPAYSADGKYVAFHATRSGANRDLYVMPSSGGRRERVVAPTQNNLAPRLSPDGSAMVYICLPPAGGPAVCGLRRGENGAGWGRPRPLFTLPGALHDWSPDGRWITYGQGNQVLRVAPDGTGRRIVATLPAGFLGLWARWAGDSRVIYVSGIAADARAVVYAVPAEGGTPREVAHSEGPTYQSYRFTFDVHGGTLYLSVADPQSDIWVTEVGRN